MSKIFEEYEKVVARKEEEKHKKNLEEFMRNAKKFKPQPIEIPNVDREPRWEARENFKEKRSGITEKAYTIVPKKQKRDFRDTELEKSMGKKADVKYLDETISKRFVCDGATLICKHLKVAERLVLRVTDKGARLQGGNPIATEDDVLPENFEFQYSPIFTNDNFGNSNGDITEKTKGLCDATGNVCVIQNAYWTKMATSILNNGKAMIFDTSELYCAIDESSPITVEYNGQDFSELEGGWNSLTRTHKNNPVLYNFSKSLLLIYFFGDFSQVEDFASSIVSYAADEEIAIYSEIGYIGPSSGIYENIKDFGTPLIEGIGNGVKEYQKDLKQYEPTGKGKNSKRHSLNANKEIKVNGKSLKPKKGETYNKFFERIRGEYKVENLKSIAKDTVKNLSSVILEKTVDKVMIDYNSFIPTEARYNQSIDYFNKVYYIEDYTKK
ncbi:PAAR-like protein [Leptotrichia massiliensis]|uniref:PAAR-like protein n=1 Tax=Leptotrichia massiliensis TaxID=1852388 RepID=UPI0028E539B4|nr:PAAR-like protein [Leptotrichia massiliensis]